MDDCNANFPTAFGNADAAYVREQLVAAERRGKIRRTVNAPAFLILDKDGQVLSCLMRNTSATGALLELSETVLAGRGFPFAVGDRSVLFILEVARSQVVDIEVARLVPPAMGVRYVGAFSTFDTANDVRID